MAFKVNYNQQRAERNRAKQAKKEEKQRAQEEEVMRRKNGGGVTDIAAETLPSGERLPADPVPSAPEPQPRD